MTVANTIQKTTIRFLEQSKQNKKSNEEDKGKKRLAISLVRTRLFNVQIYMNL